MKTLRCAVVVLCCLTPMAVLSQTPKEAAAAEQQIKSLTSQMYEAEKRKDIDFIFTHLSEDFAEVAGDGKIYRRDDIKAAFSGLVLRDYKLSDCIFKLMTGDSAYMSCLMEVDATFNGQQFPKQFRVSWVWSKVKGKWLVRFEQGTLIPEAAKK